MKTMTKQQAIEALNEGKRLSHVNFSPDEWMEFKDGLLYFEDGCLCTLHDFFTDRQNESWDNGYFLWEKTYTEKNIRTALRSTLFVLSKAALQYEELPEHSMLVANEVINCGDGESLYEKTLINLFFNIINTL